MALPYPTKVVLPFDIATAQDMNERHANDVALADGSGLDDGAVTPAKTSGIWWEELGRTKLSSSSSSINVTLSASRKFLHIMIFISGQSATGIAPAIQFNNDTGNNYAYRGDNDSAGMSSVTSNASIVVGNANGWPATRTITVDVFGIANRNKAVTFKESGTAANATVVPFTRTGYGMWSNTTSAITSVKLITGSSATFNAESEMVVLGKN